MQGEIEKYERLMKEGKRGKANEIYTKNPGVQKHVQIGRAVGDYPRKPPLMLKELLQKFFGNSKNLWFFAVNLCLQAEIRYRRLPGCSGYPVFLR